MSTRLPRVLLSGFISLLLCQAPARAQSDDSPRAKEASARFLRGVDLYQSGDIRAALIEFKRAYAIKPHYQLLFNIGQASAELRDYVAARTSLSSYLEEGGRQISAERRSEVRAEIKRLSTYLAEITLKISVPGATIRVDDIETQLPAAGKPLLVSAGRRKLEVSKVGYRKWEHVLDVAGQERIPLTVKLEALRTKTQPNLRPQAPGAMGTRPPYRLGPLFWTGAVSTVLFGTATAVLASNTKRHQDLFYSELDRVPTTQASIDLSAQKLRKMALITDIALAATSGAALVTIASAIWGSRKYRRRLREDRRRYSITPVGVQIAGRF